MDYGNELKTTNGRAETIQKQEDQLAQMLSQLQQQLQLEQINCKNCMIINSSIASNFSSR